MLPMLSVESMSSLAIPMSGPLDDPGGRDSDLPPRAIGQFVHSAAQLYRLKHLRLYDYWNSVRRPGLPLPARRDIDPIAIPDLLDGIWMTDIVVEDGAMRFRERLVGTALARLFGRDTTGRFFEDVYKGDHLVRQLAIYQAVATQGLPHVSRLRVPMEGREFLIYDRLMLPLAGDHRTPDIILGIHAYEREPGEADIDVGADAAIPNVQVT